MKLLCAMIVLLLVAGQIVYADDEAANRPVVRASEYGTVYARSLPDDSHGQKGKTAVYGVEREDDTLICTYDWFASEIYIGGNGSGTLIRFGPWQRGRKPEEGHLAIGIYRDGKTIKEYSTADIEKKGSGVSTSVSHYQVFGKRIGFRWQQGNDWVYEVNGINGRVFTFDLNTGNLIEKEHGPSTKDECLPQTKSPADDEK